MNDVIRTAQKRPKKRKTIKVDLRIPSELLAFYEGVAAYTGLKLNDVLSVVLTIDAMRRNK